MRLERGLRWSIYAIVLALFATGVAWWALGEGHGAARLYLIAAHGLAAMAFLVALGAIIVLHVQAGWRRRLNRASGALTLAMVILLTLTAFLLYYVGSDAVRSLASGIHIFVGLGLPLMLVVHVTLGRRARLRAAAMRADG